MAANIWRSLRSFVYQPLARAYERSVEWIGVEDLPDLEIASLRPGSKVDIPKGDIPFLLHGPAGSNAGGEYLELPPSITALFNDPLYSARYQMVFLSRHRVLADTINDAYPFRIGAANLYGPPVRRIPGYSTSFRARWNNFYHLLIDVLPRLELLRHSYFERYDEIELICPGGLQPLERTLLDRMGMPPRTRILEVEEDGLYRPEHYIHISYPTLRFCGAVPGWYRDRVRECIVPNRPSRHGNRILISRQRAKKRRLLNFDELEAALRPRGFDVVELEALDFESQVELFYDAEAVVGTHGAGLTNVLFSEAVKVVEIFPSWYVLPHYLYLCRSLGHPYDYCVTKDLPEGTVVEEERQTVLNDLLRHNDAHFTVDVQGVLDRLRMLGVS